MKPSDDKRIELRWNYPTEPAECNLYFVVSGTVDGASIQQIVGGNNREHLLEALNSNSASLQISAANKLGVGPSSPTVNVSHQQVGRSGLFMERTPTETSLNENILCIFSHPYKN